MFILNYTHSLKVKAEMIRQRYEGYNYLCIILLQDIVIYIYIYIYIYIHRLFLLMYIHIYIQIYKYI